MKYTRIIGSEDIKVSLLMVFKNFSKCLLTGLLFFVIGIVISFGGGVDNYYKASANLYCPLNENYAQVTSVTQVVSGYSSLIKSQKVAERAISSLGNTNLTYRQIQNMVSYSQPSNGVNLVINVTSNDADEAVAVANAVANAFVEEIRIMTGTDAVQILSAADSAFLAENGFIGLWESRIMFFIAGIVLMAFFIFVKELFSDKLRSTDQCLLTDDDVILGVIPEIEEINEQR
ncbi:hypothetical protein [Butyrivibrio sp. XPD2006]|uniref:hypothetical protein n=1 Tax=Butyrivibrio sp. XPD2006 TaxID=1280668 RepID=UPI0003B4EFCD|nr:hypothetical protein [Butyrivibrio sp. XPD2006]